MSRSSISSIEQGLVRDFGDLYSLDASQLETLVVTPREPRSDRAVPRKLGKVGLNVIAEIERSKQNDLSRLVYALGIRHVGEKAAATVARYLRTMTAIMEASVEQLQAIPDIGPVVAARFAASGRAAEPRVAREAGGGGSEHDEPSAASGRGKAGSACGQDFRAHRTLTT